jgi:hypothetical protein
LRDYYEKLRDAILRDVRGKLLDPLEDKAAERIKKDLDIAAECDEIINETEEENEFEKLSQKAQDEINAIIERDLNGKAIQSKD